MPVLTSEVVDENQCEGHSELNLLWHVRNATRSVKFAAYLKQIVTHKSFIYFIVCDVYIK